jgi:toxin ParE1/3/4
MPPAAELGVRYDVVLAPLALDDLKAIFDFIAGDAGFDIADAYVARMEAACQRLTSFPHRGTPRDDLVPGLRTLAFERRATIAYMVEAGTVTIQRVLYGGRDIGAALATRPAP